MKRLKAIWACLLLSAVTASAQNIIVQQNINGASSNNSVVDPNTFYINGISSKKNVGGVDAKNETIRVQDAYYSLRRYNWRLKNYNAFPVMVYYEFDCERGHQTGSKYLEAKGVDGSSDMVDDNLYRNISGFRMIVTKLHQ